MEHLEAHSVPLGGIRLVEASAGTGKTFTLTTLYLRIIMEEDYEADQILVVTFTKAAAAELRERIRARLREMETSLASRLSGEGFDSRGELSVIDRLAEASMERGQPEEELGRLRRVLRNFDEAQISTIHGFCDRMLEENAFESGASFDTELVQDANLLREEVAEDFWSKNFFDAPPGFVQWVLESSRASQSKSAQLLSRFLSSVLERPRVKLRPEEMETEDLATLEADVRSAQEAARVIWDAEREDILELLLVSRNDGVLNKGSYKPVNIESKWPPMMELFLSQDGVGASKERGKLDPFRTSILEKRTSVKRKGDTPEHPFFEACEEWLSLAAELEAAYESEWIALELGFAEYARGEIEARQGRSGTRTFNDLLIDLATALEGPSGDRLAARIRHRFPAAMIDEFQDTDPIQYQIFSRIWGEGEGPFFLIGDPKQAIYSFRGADIFAYIRAKLDARDSQYTLDLNWRSDTSLVEAVNGIFQQIPSPFLFEPIPFHAARTPKLSRERMGAEAGAACRFLLFGHDEAGKARTVKYAGKRAAEATAADIARLLGSGALIEEEAGSSRPVRSADIAILCRNRYQAADSREALEALGIASVMTGQESVFETEEALEFEWLLEATADPADLRALRPALCTRILGGNAKTLFDLHEDTDAWDEPLEAARGWQAAWDRAGPVGLLEWVLSKDDTRARLLSRTDGERRLTNWLHLAELLQQNWQKGRPGPGALAVYLGTLRKDSRSRRELTDDDALIRLESDEHAVKLVTIHKSKGLQYPVVYCPFLWNDQMLGKQEKAWTPFHEPDEEQALVLDIGEGEEHTRALARAGWEALAEDLRLVYVGLTRAEHRLVIVWGPVAQAGSSALGLLLHPPEDFGSWRENWNEDPAKRLRDHFKSLDDEGLRSDLEALAGSSDGGITVEILSDEDEAPSVPSEKTEESLAARTRLRFSWQGPWRVSSFSGLISSASAEGGRALNHPRALGLDYDDPVLSSTGSVDAAETESQIRLADFPAGAASGTLIHHVLEHLDFTDRDPQSKLAVVESSMLRHGMAESWAPTLAEALPDMLEAPLGGPLRDFSLSQLPRGDRMDELEFTLPVSASGASPLTAEALGRAFSEEATDPFVAEYARRAGLLGFPPLEGHLRGFVDLVFRHDGRFYVVDYKSNRLGVHRSDYDEPGMQASMLEHDYVLQYHLYAVALHRMLEVRLPDYDYETHMGGAYYLFLRGMTPEPGDANGIYFDRPPKELILALSRALGPAPASKEAAPA